MLGDTDLQELLVKPKENVAAWHSAEPDLCSLVNEINWSFARKRTVKFGSDRHCQCRIIYYKY